MRKSEKAETEEYVPLEDRAARAGLRIRRARSLWIGVWVSFASIVILIGALVVFVCRLTAVGGQ